MKEIFIVQGITIVLMLLGFLGNALYFRGVFKTRLDNQEEDIRDLKKHVRYKDTCEKTHIAVDQRISRLETKSNGY